MFPTDGGNFTGEVTYADVEPATLAAACRTAGRQTAADAQSETVVIAAAAATPQAGPSPNVG